VPVTRSTARSRSRSGRRDDSEVSAVAMRVLRVIAAVVVWLVASLLLAVAALLCVSILLLPVGLLLGLAALRLYGMGLRLLLPRPRDIDRGLRRKARRWWRKSPLRELSPERGRKSRPGSARELARRVGLGGSFLDCRWAILDRR
jgi:hypothetical protein